MGYQPALDGLRALSVIAVIFYHAGFSWMHGGFFGVEVFFVGAVNVYDRQHGRFHLSRSRTFVLFIAVT